MSSFTVTVIVQEALEKIIKVTVKSNDSNDAKDRAYAIVSSKYRESEIVLSDIAFIDSDIIIENIEKD
ncbi:hypothetical protein [Erysipelothrix aquatica]|uniref:hypothetical protein n=1 Tax=Erysipelothrix aquatica TaxID=2683714 RepID=UPI0013596104|nr:hypothetical protein [Erysipelothrix aquatica]